jgi:hypothetical protein
VRQQAQQAGQPDCCQQLLVPERAGRTPCGLQSLAGAEVVCIENVNRCQRSKVCVHCHVRWQRPVPLAASAHLRSNHSLHWRIIAFSNQSHPYATLCTCKWTSEKSNPAGSTMRLLLRAGTAQRAGRRAVEATGSQMYRSGRQQTDYLTSVLTVTLFAQSVRGASCPELQPWTTPLPCPVPTFPAQFPIHLQCTGTAAVSDSPGHSQAAATTETRAPKWVRLHWQ